MTRSHVYLALIATLCLCFISKTPTFGSIQSNTSAEDSVVSGYWASTINSATGSSSNAPYSITWTGNIKKQYALISLINSGSYELKSNHISFISAKSNGDSSNPPSLTFDLCSGTWNSTNYSCTGTITTLGTATIGTIDVTQPVVVGNRLVIRITNLHDSSFNYITTLNGLATRTDIRLGIVTSS